MESRSFNDRLVFHFENRGFVEKLQSFLRENARTVVDDFSSLKSQHQKGSEPASRTKKQVISESKTIWISYAAIVEGHISIFRQQERLTNTEMDDEIEFNASRRPDLLKLVTISWNFESFVNYCEEIVKIRRDKILRQFFPSPTPASTTSSEQPSLDPDLGFRLLRHLKIRGFRKNVESFLRNNSSRLTSEDQSRQLWNDFSTIVDNHIDLFLQSDPNVDIKKLKLSLQSVVEVEERAVKPVLAAWDFSTFKNVFCRPDQHSQFSTNQFSASMPIMPTNSTQVLPHSGLGLPGGPKAMAVTFPVSSQAQPGHRLNESPSSPTPSQSSSLLGFDLLESPTLSPSDRKPGSGEWKLFDDDITSGGAVPGATQSTPHATSSHDQHTPRTGTGSFKSLELAPSNAHAPEDPSTSIAAPGWRPHSGGHVEGEGEAMTGMELQSQIIDHLCRDDFKSAVESFLLFHEERLGRENLSLSDHFGDVKMLKVRRHR